MRSGWVVVLALALALGACGDDSEAVVAESSSTTTSTTTESPVTTGTLAQQLVDLPDLPDTDDFCDFVAESEAISDALLFESEEDAEVFYRFLATSAERANELAPVEVADDWEQSLGPFRGFIELLEELEWDAFAAFDSDDPRAAAFADPALEEFDQRIDDFCAGDAEEPPDGPGSGEVSESTDFDDNEGQIPFLGGLDTDGLQAYVDAVDERYLAGADADSRVAQLEANCEWDGATYQLNDVALQAASRPGVLPEILIQHAYVCPGSVTNLELDLSTIDRVFDPDLDGLRAFAAVTNPRVLVDEELFGRFTNRLEENCADRSVLRNLLLEAGDPPSSIIGWHAYICPEFVTQLFG